MLCRKRENRFTQALPMVMNIDLTFLEGSLAIGRKILNRRTLIQQFCLKEFIIKK